MKTILQLTAFFFAGAMLFSACSEEKTGKAPEKIAEELTENLEKVIPDSIPLDTAAVEKSKPKIVPPPPLPPMPPPGPMPEPDPRPWPPEPWPIKPPPPPPSPIPQPDPIVDFPEVEPAFPGDSNTDHTKMMKFISDNIQYPEMDKEQGNQGKVYVEFVVETDGSLTNLKILRGVSPTIDKEALRVMRLMPKWIPGQQNGKAVRCRSRLPIMFRLD